MAEARDLYEEGALMFAATRIQKGYAMQDDIVRIGRMRIRSPEQWYGDLLALIGAARAGERGLEALGEEFGWDVLDGFAAEWLDYSERAVTARDPFPAPGEGGRGVVSRSLSRHSGRAESTVRAEVEILPHEERIVVDLRDNPDCLPCGLNMSEATSRSAALIGVFNSLGSDPAGKLRKREPGGGAPARELRRRNTELDHELLGGDDPISPTGWQTRCTRRWPRSTTGWEWRRAAR